MAVVPNTFLPTAVQPSGSLLPTVSFKVGSVKLCVTLNFPTVVPSKVELSVNLLVAVTGMALPSFGVISIGAPALSLISHSVVGSVCFASALY